MASINASRWDPRLNAHFHRERVPERGERVPERVVHAKGGGAFGYFEVTGDVSRYTRADFLSEVGLQTDVLVRFSSVAGKPGHTGTGRGDTRGFAVKFYTAEGIYDLVGSDTPGHQWLSRAGRTVRVKYHFKTELGVTNMTRRDAVRIAGEDPDFHRRSLFELIDGGGTASWKVFVQIMPLEDAATNRFDPFDLTTVRSREDYPLVPLGRLVLDRNPENFHTDIEQAAFEPSNVVPGVSFSPDTMLQGRLFAYTGAHPHRIGTNGAPLPVNGPRAGRRLKPEDEDS